MFGRGLYAIVDVGALDRASIPVVPFAERVLQGAPRVVQLRAKERPPVEYLALLRELAPRCRALGVPLFANDRPDLAVLAACDGVHVGQDDLSVQDVRRFAPGLAVGVSTHTESQLAAALALAPDYVAFGPVFATATKRDAEPVVGIDALARAHDVCARRRVPLVAIGGIDLARAPDVATRATMGAVIGALLPSHGLDEVTELTRAIALALGQGTPPAPGGRASHEG